MFGFLTGFFEGTSLFFSLRIGILFFLAHVVHWEMVLDEAEEILDMAFFVIYHPLPILLAFFTFLCIGDVHIFYPIQTLVFFNDLCHEIIEIVIQHLFFLID